MLRPYLCALLLATAAACDGDSSGSGLSASFVPLADFYTPQEEGQVRALRFTPDGTSLLTGHSSGAIYQWNASTGALQKTVQEPTYRTPEAVAFSAGGEFFVVGTHDGMLLVYDGATFDSLGVIDNPEPGEGSIVALEAGTSPGSVLVSRSVAYVSNPRPVQRYDVATGQVTAQLDAGSPGALSPYLLGVHPRAAMVATGGGVYDSRFVRSVTLWDALTGALMREVAQTRVGPASLGFDEEGHRLVLAADSHLTVVDAVRGEESARWKTDRVVYFAAFASDGVLVSVGDSFRSALDGGEQVIEAWSVDGTRLGRRTAEYPGNFASECAVHPAGTSVACSLNSRLMILGLEISEGER